MLINATKKLKTFFYWIKEYYLIKFGDQSLTVQCLILIAYKSNKYYCNDHIFTHLSQANPKRSKMESRRQLVQTKMVQHKFWIIKSCAATVVLLVFYNPKSYFVRLQDLFKYKFNGEINEQLLKQVHTIKFEVFFTEKLFPTNCYFCKFTVESYNSKRQPFVVLSVALCLLWLMTMKTEPVVTVQRN